MGELHTQQGIFFLPIFNRNCNNFSFYGFITSESRTGIVEKSLLKLLKLLSTRISPLCDSPPNDTLFSGEAKEAQQERIAKDILGSQFRSVGSIIFFIIQIDYFAFHQFLALNNFSHVRKRDQVFLLLLKTLK